MHPYTFRAENFFLPVDYRVGSDAIHYGRAIDEHVTYLRAGIDGLFTDQPDIGVEARTEVELFRTGPSGLTGWQASGFAVARIGPAVDRLPRPALG